MPNIESAKKQQRISLKKRALNKNVVSQAKTMVRKAEESIEAGNAETAAADVKAAISTLDKAKGKGVIHPKNAARHKSRLVKSLNKAQPASSAK